MTMLDDLLRRVEALEALEQQRAATEPAPAPAPTADRPLWEVMQQAWRDSESIECSIARRYAAEIDAVADWLSAREYFATAEMLRAEAIRARESQ